MPMGPEQVRDYINHQRNLARGVPISADTLRQIGSDSMQFLSTGEELLLKITADDTGLCPEILLRLYLSSGRQSDDFRDEVQELLRAMRQRGISPSMVYLGHLIYDEEARKYFLGPVVGE